MVRCDDTGAVYALQAERYYDYPDEDAELCGNCEHLPEENLCPCGCGYGTCEYYGRWVSQDDSCVEHFKKRVKCPICGATTYPDDGWNYCHRCGRRLEGNDE